MATAQPILQSVAPSGVKPRGRLVEIDILRGFLLLWMTLTHLPTKASLISNQTFGFVSGAEGFIFLAGFMVGQLEFRKEEKSGISATLRDLSKRTVRIYLYHCALLVMAFTVFAEIGVSWHRMGLQNLLSFYLAQPKHAVIAALLLQYRPALLDILPMYIVFMALTPLARKIARTWGWDPVIYISFMLWAAAQFGLRGWIFRHVNLFGLSVPEASTGAFDSYAWQLLWMVGLGLGTIYAESLARPLQSSAESDVGIPRWLLTLSIAIAGLYLILRYSPYEHWIDLNTYGWLIDKWHLGPARVINFAALSIILVRFGTHIAALPFVKPLASLGQASIEVFSVHVLCCLAGHSLSTDADPNLPWWQQAILLAATISALFLTAHLQHIWVGRKREDKQLPVATNGLKTARQP
jgi:hypothetical protein